METGLKRARANWDGAILICGKCTKKQSGGFGAKGRTSLAKLLRAVPGFGKGRKAATGVIETKCLGLCPKHGVAIVDTRRPGEWLIVPAGADVHDLTELLQQQIAGHFAYDRNPGRLP